MEKHSDVSKVSFLKYWSERINMYCERVLFISIAAMTVVTLMQIVFRIGFKALTWSEELTCFLLVAASFLGTAIAFKRGAHIAVSFLLGIMPKPLKKVSKVCIEIVGITFFATVSWYGAILCWQERTQTATAIAVSMSWIYLIFPLTGLIVILHLLANLEEILKESA